MHVVCLVSLKGGSGKSTVVQSLAVCACQNDQETLIIELDPQGTLKNWSNRREAAQPEVHPTLPQSLDEVLIDARNRRVRWVFVDTPGHKSAAARAAMDVADLILIPCKIQSMKDFDAAMLTITDAKQANKPAFVVMNQVPPNASKLVRKRQIQLQQKYNIAVLSRYLSRRADFEYCDERGLSATEFNPNSPAAEEVSQLYQLLLSIFIIERSKELAAQSDGLQTIEDPSIIITESQIIADTIEQEALESSDSQIIEREIDPDEIEEEQPEPEEANITIGDIDNAEPEADETQSIVAPVEAAALQPAEEQVEQSKAEVGEPATTEVQITVDPIEPATADPVEEQIREGQTVPDEPAIAEAQITVNSINVEAQIAERPSVIVGLTKH
jgi:chromosome partitioning protein